MVQNMTDIPHALACEPTSNTDTLRLEPLTAILLTGLCGLKGRSQWAMRKPRAEIRSSQHFLSEERQPERDKWTHPAKIASPRLTMEKRS